MNWNKVTTKIDYALPTLDVVRLCGFGEDRQISYLRSLWLGLSQPVLNVPRVLITCLWQAILIILGSVIRALWALIAASGVVLFWTLVMIVAGLLGRVTDQAPAGQATDGQA